MRLKCVLHALAGLPVCAVRRSTCLCLMLCHMRCGQRGFPALVTSHWIGFKFAQCVGSEIQLLFILLLSTNLLTSNLSLLMNNFYMFSLTKFIDITNKPLICWCYNYLLWVNKNNNLTFHQNFVKCTPIYKILSLSDSWEHFVHTYHKDSPPHLKYVSKLACESWKLQLTTAPEDCI